MNTKALKLALLGADVSNRTAAAELGISETAFYNKMSGKAEFKNSEIRTLIKILHLDAAAVNLIFFT